MINHGQRIAPIVTYIHIKGSMRVPNRADADATVNNINKKVIFKNCSPFNNCTSEIINDAHDIDVVMSMYNLIENNDVYSKKLGSSWQYYR